MLLVLVSAFSCAYSDKEMVLCIHPSVLTKRASDQLHLLSLLLYMRWVISHLKLTLQAAQGRNSAEM